MSDWLTNDPAAAAQLRTADRDYERARQKAQHYPLAEKIEAYRQAREDWRRAYARVLIEETT